LSDPKLISPLLTDYLMGSPVSEHHGVCCCPAIRKESEQKYIVKIISLPASQVQMDALILAGACKNEEEALNYFRELSESAAEEAELLQRLSRMEGFAAYDGWQDNTAFSINGIYVQDRYAIADPSEKQAEITDALTVAREQSHALVLNYTSCYLTSGFPPSYAATPAKTVLPWLKKQLTDTNNVSGVIICDFMTSELCETIWRCNFR